MPAVTLWPGGVQAGVRGEEVICRERRAGRHITQVSVTPPSVKSSRTEPLNPKAGLVARFAAV